MSTRGLVAIRLNGLLRGVYSRYDSYPSFLGAKVVLSIKDALLPFQSKYKTVLCKNAKKVSWGNEDSLSLSPELLPYVLLPRALGLIHPDGAVREYHAKLNHLRDDANFLNDKLFCEWAYILDLDSKQFTMICGDLTTNWPLFDPPSVEQMDRVPR
jgi:hypothetical protein